MPDTLAASLDPAERRKLRSRAKRPGVSESALAGTLIAEKLAGSATKERAFASENLIGKFKIGTDPGNRDVRAAVARRA